MPGLTIFGNLLELAGFRVVIASSGAVATVADVAATLASRTARAIDATLPAVVTTAAGTADHPGQVVIIEDPQRLPRQSQLFHAFPPVTFQRASTPLVRSA